MSTILDEQDELLHEVRKTISDNKHFLDRLLDEEEDAQEEEEQEESDAVKEEFEEL
jgi:hypothetical protein